MDEAAVLEAAAARSGWRGGRTAEMPKGPKGEKRPADAVGNAVRVMRIAADLFARQRGVTVRYWRGEGRFRDWI
jgi:hypothetical protein